MRTQPSAVSVNALNLRGYGHSETNKIAPRPLVVRATWAYAHGSIRVNADTRSAARGLIFPVNSQRGTICCAPFSLLRELYAKAVSRHCRPWGFQRRRTVAGHHEQLKTVWRVYASEPPGAYAAKVGKSTITTNLAAYFALQGWHRCRYERPIAREDALGGAWPPRFDRTGHCQLWGHWDQGLDGFVPGKDDKTPVVWNGSQAETFLWRGTMEMHSLGEFLADVQWQPGSPAIDLPPRGRASVHAV